jgi:hypothetical protein
MVHKSLTDIRIRVCFGEGKEKPKARKSVIRLSLNHVSISSRSVPDESSEPAEITKRGK